MIMIITRRRNELISYLKQSGLAERMIIINAEALVYPKLSKYSRFCESATTTDTIPDDAFLAFRVHSTA